MEKIKALMQKMGDYEQSGMADVASLNLNYDEREVIRRALVCHLTFLQVDSKQIKERLKAEEQENEQGKEQKAEQEKEGQ